MGRDRFTALAEKRVSKALKDLELIGNLGNRSNYDYTADQADQIFRALDKALKDCKARFTQPEDLNAESGFRFK